MDGNEANAGEAIELISELGALPREQLLARINDSSFRVELEAKLSKTSPFSQVQDNWLLHPDGGGHNSVGVASHWVIERVLLGEGPDLIVNEAARQLSANTMVVLEVTAVKGVTVSEQQNLTRDVWFIPNSLVSNHHYADKIFSDTNFDFPFRSDWAALVQRFVLSPVAVPAEGRIKAIEQNSKAVDGRRGQREDLLRALYLTVDGPVELGGTIQLVEDGEIFRFGYSMLGSVGTKFVGTSSALDLEATRKFSDLLSSFRERPAINVTLDRLGRATIERDPADKAIDLGLALETALMANDPTANQEISNKLGTRAAWLLGKNSAERREIYGEASQLYSARSDGAHRGIITAKTARKYKFENGRRLVRNCIAKILERGTFPDWTDLTLGGDG